MQFDEVLLSFKYVCAVHLLFDMVCHFFSLLLLADFHACEVATLVASWISSSPGGPELRVAFTA